MCLGVEKRVVAREVSVFRVGIEGLCLLETRAGPRLLFV